ncbi:MAG: hypothetical protein DRN14_07930 [Thermoplasmata archaeon]|nr:MAG: hypothetical protein DRN14_07930 [Thermoplasmata archaeon]
MEKKELEAFKERLLSKAEGLFDDVAEAARDFFILRISIKYTGEAGEELAGEYLLDLLTGDQDILVPKAGGKVDMEMLGLLVDFAKESLSLRKDILKGLGQLTKIVELAGLV